VLLGYILGAFFTKSSGYADYVNHV
jgi:hypothetical protein